MRAFPKTARLAIAALALGTAALTLAPTDAQAWWARPGVWVAGPAPVYVPGPRVVYAPYGRHWVRAHYDWRGAFIPGHWI